MAYYVSHNTYYLAWSDNTKQKILPKNMVDMESKKIKKFLEEFTLFAEMDDKDIDALLEYLNVKTISKGEVLFEQGTPRVYLFMIISGAIGLSRKDATGEASQIATYRKGESLGEGAIMGNYPHSTRAIAVRDTVLLTIHRDAFFEFMTKRPEAGITMIAEVTQIISRRLRRSTNQFTHIAAQYISGKTRLEHDMLGDKEVPYDAYYGVQTVRAFENFNISGVSINHYKSLIVALAQVKWAAAAANMEVGTLSEKIGSAIIEACKDIIGGKYHTHFIVDIFQGGAGTSTNMNANEVIANRALEIMGYEKGNYDYCHPNEHVNLAQSTNDVYPTALKIAYNYANLKLTKSLRNLINSFRKKSKEFRHVIKMGRTQLQDAVPMTLGQEFGAFAATLEEEIRRLDNVTHLFYEVNMGGTAIGTGLNANESYRDAVVEHLKEITGLPIIAAPNLIEATQDTGAFIMYSSAVKRLAIKLSKICNDLRLLSSGPTAGLNEINLPKMQPGSSIMPGKVNPVIPEVVNQIAYKVIGNDLTVTLAAEAGQLQLNVMEPVIAQSLFENLELLINSMITLRLRCIDGITANEEVCRRMVENSISIVTALNPELGYKISSELSKEAVQTGKSVYKLVLEKKLLSKEKLDELLSPENLVGVSLD